VPLTYWARTSPASLAALIEEAASAARMAGSSVPALSQEKR
jgi:hypothetical protein